MLRQRSLLSTITAWYSQATILRAWPSGLTSSPCSLAREFLTVVRSLFSAAQAASRINLCMLSITAQTAWPVAPKACCRLTSTASLLSDGNSVFLAGAENTAASECCVYLLISLLDLNCPAFLEVTGSTVMASLCTICFHSSCVAGEGWYPSAALEKADRTRNSWNPDKLGILSKGSPSSSSLLAAVISSWPSSDPGPPQGGLPGEITWSSTECLLSLGGTRTDCPPPGCCDMRGGAEKITTDVRFSWTTYLLLLWDHLCPGVCR